MHDAQCTDAHHICKRDLILEVLAIYTRMLRFPNARDYITVIIVCNIHNNFELG